MKVQYYHNFIWERDRFKVNAFEYIWMTGIALKSYDIRIFNNN